MMRLKTIAGLCAMCVMPVFFTGCGGDDDDTGGATPPPTGGGGAGTAPSSLRSRSYDLSEAGGTTTISFGASGESYTLTRFNSAQETGSYQPSRNGSDTWDLTLNNSTNGAASRLILTFASAAGGDFAYTPANGALITGTFQRSGSDPGTTTTGTTTTGGTTTGTTTTGGTGTATAAPPRLSQIVLTGKASNPAGGGQTVINFSGSTFAYAAGGFSGTASYTPSGTSANLRLTYGGTATGDVDDYTLQFRAPSGSPTPSTFSGTQKVGAAAPAPASGTFTYTQ